MESSHRAFPSFASLRAFEAVARLGQVTRAAEELHLTQSAISHRLKDLERYLGITLFSSGRTGVALTEAGRDLSVNLSGIFHRLESVLRNAVPSLPQHKLTVSVHPAFGTLWLAPRLENLFSSHPELLLDIRSSSTLADFGGGDGVDAAIRYGPGGWAGLHSTKMSGDRLILACNPRYNGGELPSSSWQLAGMRIMRDSHDSLIEWFESRGEAPPGMKEIIVDDPALLASAIVHQAGIGLVRETLLANELRGGTVVPLFNAAVPTRYGYHFVCPVSRAAEPKITLFREWLCAMSRE